MLFTTYHPTDHYKVWPTDLFFTYSFNNNFYNILQSLLQEFRTNKIMYRYFIADNRFQEALEPTTTACTALLEISI